VSVDGGAPRAGEVLGGKYCVERVLGQGGMGVVVAATHMDLHQTVALKLMLPHAAAKPEAVKRFVREARAAVRLRSTHAARVLDVGTLDTGMPYMVVEYLEGTDLARHLAQKQRLAAGTIADVVLQACDALAEAHAQGIVHRDLKPGNLFLARSANGTVTVKVIDFGVSKIRTSMDPTMTGTDTVLGSPAYMSPEQMRATRSVDGRTDIWSLGVILYQAVTGSLPFVADEYPALCLKVMLDPVPPLPSLPDIPRGFEQVIRRCLEKEPERRYATIAELAADLARFASTGGRLLAEQIGRVPPPGALSDDSDLAIDTTLNAAASQSSTLQPARRWPRWATIAVPAILVTGVALAVVGLSARAPEPRPETPATAAAASPPPAVPAAAPTTAVAATATSPAASPAPTPPAAAPTPVPAAAPPADAAPPPPAATPDAGHAAPPAPSPAPARPPRIKPTRKPTAAPAGPAAPAPLDPEKVFSPGE
jgi:eukaryotic-like serine/threonine-protein kinase